MPIYKLKTRSSNTDNDIEKTEKEPFEYYDENDIRRKSDDWIDDKGIRHAGNEWFDIYGIKHCDND